MDWLVLKMDDGVLRRERTRAAAVRWWKRHQGHSRVLRRHKYRAGAYQYVTSGDNPHEASSVFIEREDVAPAGGWDVSQRPLYPHATEPFARVDRAGGAPAGV